MVFEVATYYLPTVYCNPMFLSLLIVYFTCFDCTCGVFVVFILKKETQKLET